MYIIYNNTYIYTYIYVNKRINKNKKIYCMHKIKRRERPFATINSKTRVLRNKNKYICLSLLLTVSSAHPLSPF